MTIKTKTYKLIENRFVNMSNILDNMYILLDIVDKNAYFIIAVKIKRHLIRL